MVGYGTSSAGATIIHPPERTELFREHFGPEHNNSEARDAGTVAAEAADDRWAEGVGAHSLAL